MKTDNYQTVQVRRCAWAQREDLGEETLRTCAEERKEKHGGEEARERGEEEDEEAKRWRDK